MYHRTRSALAGCACRGHGKSALGCGCMGDAGDGLGDDLLDPTQVAAQGAPASVNPIAFLQAQINRYVAPTAPAGYQYGAAIPVTGNLDQTTALRALVIVQRRAIEAGMTDAVQQVTTALITNPVGFVQAHQNYVIDTVRIYGDLHGVPPAADVGGDLIPGVPTWLLAVAAAGVAYYLWGRA